MVNSLSNQRTRCEVWTRVMGYHRPVSQFNKGKKSEFYSRVYYKEQEYTDRFLKTYVMEEHADKEHDTLSQTIVAYYLLFTTSTCQKCPAIKQWIQDNLTHISGVCVSNVDEAFYELAEKNEVLAAPTLIAFDSTGKELFRGDDLSVIAAYFSPVLSCVSQA